MARNVQLVLRANVPHLGSVGDIVKVKPGFARNYLLPRSLAAPATDHHIKAVEKLKRLEKERQVKLRREAEDIKAMLAEMTFQFEKKAGEGGKLYGSVTTVEVAELLQSKGYAVEKRNISLPEGGVKTTGTHSLTASLAGGVAAEIKIEVIEKAEE